MGQIHDLTGQRFGRLTVIEFAGISKGRNAKWLCHCDCGSEVVVLSRSLKSGRTNSCGCLKLDLLNQHGMSKSRLYREWRGIKVRCLNASDPHFPDYGGRGITICEEWVDSFENFRDWALTSGYHDGLTIDRIDNNGPYSPDNCRWSTMKEQQNNKRNNKLITFEGETHTVTEWAAIKGIDRHALYSRLKRGWPIEKIFSSPRR